MWRILAAGLACMTVHTASGQGGILLRDATPEVNLAFRHTDGSSGKHYIMETVSAGLALFDYDGDGDIDIYFLNGAPLSGTNVAEAPQNALYRNDGGFRFSDVTESAGVGDTGYGLGVVAGDYDNDGDLDLYLNNYGPNVLYRNNGDGTFADVTQAAGVANGHKVGAGACFLDMDKDGDLDLYVANYLEFSYAAHVDRTSHGVAVYVDPTHYPPVPDTLYRNNGDGTFTDVSAASGVAAYAGWGMGMVCGDYDSDGDTDLFIGNDVSENFLFQNDGSGRFTEVGLMAGVAFDLNGIGHGSMGVACGDYDNDGWMDFYVTSYQRQLATLYRNLGGGVFEDVTRVTRAGAGTYPYVTWGAGFVDFDNDGDRDLFIACGHLQDNIDHYDSTSPYRVENILHMNTGKGMFVDVSDRCGDGLQIKRSSRGAGFDDLDNDGDIDVVVLNSRSEASILRNDSPVQNHWIQLSLRGRKTNRSGVGARVKVVAGELVLVDEVHSGRSYQSHYGMRLHFGLGRHTKLDRIEVRWIGGSLDVFKDVAVDRRLTLTEGASDVEVN
jgi:hypothetical protein